MSARSPANVIPRVLRARGAKKTVITLFFTTKKLMVLDVLPNGHKYNQQDIADYIVPDLQKANQEL
jgi:hypothetical protein